MNDIKDFVSNILLGNNVEAKENFNDLVSARAMDALGERKQQIAQSLFQTEEVELDEEKVALKTSNNATLYKHPNGDHSIIRNRDGKQLHYGTETSAKKLWTDIYSRKMKKEEVESIEEGPVGAALGGIAGTMLGGPVGGAIGAALGHKAGNVTSSAAKKTGQAVGSAARTTGRAVKKVGGVGTGALIGGALGGPVGAAIGGYAGHRMTRKEEVEHIDEKAVSQQQQKFMGMVYAAKKGMKPASPEVAKAAASMTKKQAKDYAATKHEGLPEKK